MINFQQKKKQSYFWVSSGIQNDQNTPNSGEKAILVGVVPLKKTIIFLPFFFKKYKIYRTF